MVNQVLAIDGVALGVRSGTGRAIVCVFSFALPKPWLATSGIILLMQKRLGVMPSLDSCHMRSGVRVLSYGAFFELANV